MNKRQRKKATCKYLDTLGHLGEKHPIITHGEIKFLCKENPDRALDFKYIIPKRTPSKRLRQERLREIGSFKERMK